MDLKSLGDQIIFCKWWKILALKGCTLLSVICYYSKYYDSKLYDNLYLNISTL